MGRRYQDPIMAEYGLDPDDDPVDESAFALYGIHFDDPAAYEDEEWDEADTWLALEATDDEVECVACG